MPVTPHHFPIFAICRAELNGCLLSIALKMREAMIPGGFRHPSTPRSFNNSGSEQSSRKDFFRNQLRRVFQHNRPIANGRYGAMHDHVATGTTPQGYLHAAAIAANVIVLPRIHAFVADLISERH
jgi:hypothetical protein